MYYEFPRITHLNEVLEAVKDNDGFIVVDRGTYTIVNYVGIKHNDLFPGVWKLSDGPEVARKNSILRECRGITFDNATGRVIARKFHKFFNLGERPECDIGTFVNYNARHHIAEKLDGSMITPVPIANSSGQEGMMHIEWHTKMGKTTVADQVLPYVDENPQYHKLALVCAMEGFTPIFEWCSPQQRIVVNHKEDQLILTAIRNNETGEYHNRQQLEVVAEAWGLPLVKTFDRGNIEDFVQHTRNLTDKEGYVITFNDGHKIKLKSDWYVMLHKTKDKISHERYVVELIINEAIDDILPVLQEEDREMVEKYFNEFTYVITKEANYIRTFVNKTAAWCPDRKDFALQVTNKLQPKAQSVAFKAFPLLPAERTLKVYEELISVLKRGVSSNRNFAEVKRDFFPNIKYRGIWATDE